MALFHSQTRRHMITADNMVYNKLIKTPVIVVQFDFAFTIVEKYKTLTLCIFFLFCTFSAIVHFKWMSAFVHLKWMSRWRHCFLLLPSPLDVLRAPPLTELGAFASAYLPLRTCVIKTLTFKGGHLMWQKGVSTTKGHALKGMVWKGACL